MSISALLANPGVIDRAGLEEYLQNLADLIPGVERGIAKLKRQPHDQELIAELFRALHNLKGDAAICQVKLGVILAHPIETLFARLRSGELVFDPLLAELVLLATDKLELAIEALAAGRPLSHLKLQTLVDGLDALNAAPIDKVTTLAAQLIEQVTGTPPLSQLTSKASHEATTMASEQATEDLHFFQRLAFQFEERGPWLAGRSSRQLRLALDTNAVAGFSVNALQLEAAVYMHDIGMMFLPEHHWLKPGELSPDDRERIHLHPEIASGLLMRMAGWQEAALMVAQHHEMPDGHGYPHGIAGEALCDGARILAIVDAFESIMAKQAHQGQGRSLLRVMAEINASDHQFDPIWIEHFNVMIRNRTN